MEARAKPPEWRAVQAEGTGRWYLEQNIGGIWHPLVGDDNQMFSEEDAKLLVGGPRLLVQLVGLDLMMDRLRMTMTKATSMRQIRETATDAKLQAFIADVRKTIAELGGPKDANNGGRG